MKIRLAQTSPHLGDLEYNFEACREAIRRAAEEDADLIVFPELSLTGYLLKDIVPLVSLTAEDRMMRELAELSRKVSVLIGGVEHGREHFFYNSAFYFEGGELIHVHRKNYLPTYGMFDEGRYFSPGNRVQAAETRLGKVGIMICEDAWHPINPYILCLDGAQILLVMSNSPVRGMDQNGEFQSIHNWRMITQSYALLYSSFVLYVNRAGCEDGISFSGCSQAINPYGRSFADLPFLEESEMTVTLELGELPRARIYSPILRDENFLMSFNELSRIRKNTYGN
jgi:predicted amidohydrolase